MPLASVEHQTRARRYPLHSHGEYQMIFAVGGAVRLTAGGKSRDVTSPAVMFLGNLEPHSLEEITEEYDRYTVTISPREARNVMDERLLSVFLPHGGDFCPVIRLDERAAAEMRILFAALQEENDSPEFADAPDMLVRMILLRLFRYSPDSFPRQEGSAGGLIAAVRRALESELEQKLPLSALGERFHVSVYHLERLFRAQTGYSIGRYRLLCRIAAARELLALTDLSVSEIAARVGIEDASNFSRYFRRETGHSPLEYRRHARGNDPGDL